METKHIRGVFLRIKEKGHKPDVSGSNTRIFVMETPSGLLFDGLLPTKIVKSLSLRDYISVDLNDFHPVTEAGGIAGIFTEKNYKVQPAKYFASVDTSLLD